VRTRAAPSILDRLTGQDRRSIGQSPVVVRRVLRSPELLPALDRGLAVRDPIPLPLWPFRPEQTLRHYLFHALYAVTQVLVLVLTRAERRRRACRQPPQSAGYSGTSSDPDHTPDA
jgi:hypothetical protein